MELRKRYELCKSQSDGAIVLFKMGDFYEMFFDDAKDGARILGLTITTRIKAGDEPMPMAGFPYHSLDNYIRKLLGAGQKVAIAEQVADKPAYGMVKRVVTKTIKADAQ